jgi:hypothetical protein
VDRTGDDGGVQAVKLPVAAAVAAATAAVFPQPALPQGEPPPVPPRVAIQDPRDGRAPLDLREVDSALEQGSIRFTFITWTRWRSGPLQDRGYLLVDVDAHSGRRYRIIVRSSGRRLTGLLYRKGGGRERALRRLRTWRQDRRSVSVQVPAAAVGLAIPGSYSWRAQTLLTDRRCPRVCFDLVPDTGDEVVTVPAAVPM